MHYLPGSEASRTADHKVIGSFEGPDFEDNGPSPLLGEKFRSEK